MFGKGNYAVRSRFQLNASPDEVLAFSPNIEMKSEEITLLFEKFEAVAIEFNEVECWSARELQELLGYSKWENFQKVVNKAKEACSNAGEDVADHFPDVRKVIEAGKGAKHEIDDILLTRYACYLTAQNGDSRKEKVAFAQNYFMFEVGDTPAPFVEKFLAHPAQTVFEQIKRLDSDKNEFWRAREISRVLEYSQFRHFLPVIARAKEACKNSGINILDHFEDILTMVTIGSGAEREIDDVRLSRYACYLIVQNADSSKEIVALGQTYFAVQTRLQEIRQMQDYQRLKTEDEKRIFLREEMSLHNKHLAEAAKDAGVVEPLDYAIFQNHGYQGLYGGLKAKDIHARKGLKKSQQILDHMGSTELAANLFRATQTEEKLRRDEIKGKDNANQTHFEVGAKVRKTIEDIGGTMPENLPVADSIKKLDRIVPPKRLKGN